ncbi:hypothetical protein EQV77_02890 [Halobacillus fulvus]|nr:hypothetical protein EQV77_02890 [Halobacillus fulvus]
MMLEKVVLAIITTRKEKVSGSTSVFVCDTTEEMEAVAANLEAILDGIAHALSKELYIIVKH